MPLFDWLKRSGRQAAPPSVWNVHRPARELARLVCARPELPLDELTEKMFSRVGQYSPANED